MNVATPSKTKEIRDFKARPPNWLQFTMHVPALQPGLPPRVDSPVRPSRSPHTSKPATFEPVGQHIRCTLAPLAHNPTISVLKRNSKDRQRIEWRSRPFVDPERRRHEQEFIAIQP